MLQKYWLRAQLLPTAKSQEVHGAGSSAVCNIMGDNIIRRKHHPHVSSSISEVGCVRPFNRLAVARRHCRDVHAVAFGSFSMKNVNVDHGLPST